MAREGRHAALWGVLGVLLLLAVLLLAVRLLNGPSQDRERTADEVVRSAGAHHPVVTPVRRP